MCCEGGAVSRRKTGSDRCHLYRHRGVLLGDRLRQGKDDERGFRVLDALELLFPLAADQRK